MLATNARESTFNSSCQLTARADRNGNTVGYTYTSGLLTKITDPFSRETTFTYTSGRLMSVTDFAGRTATLAYDGSGRLTSITLPDPDGGGALSSPVTEFSYDATSHLLTTITNPLDDETDFTYGSHRRLTSIGYPDSTSWALTALQTVGLPSGTSGNSLTAASPSGHATDVSVVSDFKTDRFGNVTLWIDPLDNETATERNSRGWLVSVTRPDPDGAGSLTAPESTYSYDARGNLTMVGEAWMDGSASIQYEYDAADRRIKMKSGTIGTDETDYVYDNLARLIKVTNPLDEET
ncbi:MAG: RHS repeat protein, partial [Pirellulaceae bacterium]|nr:RHS repeat protein [Pirellulaceae bacterium]